VMYSSMYYKNTELWSLGLDNVELSWYVSVVMWSGGCAGWVCGASGCAVAW
jgi:hypothetical protein